MDLDLVRHSSEARVAFVPPVSIEDRPLLWMVVRSQTYYPEHILAYRSVNYINVADVEFIQNFHKIFLQRKRLTACYHSKYINVPHVSA